MERSFNNQLLPVNVIADTIKAALEGIFGDQWTKSPAVEALKEVLAEINIHTIKDSLGKLQEAFGNFTAQEIPGAVVTVLTDAISQLFAYLLPNEVSFGKLTFTNVGDKTTIYTGMTKSVIIGTFLGIT